MNPSPQAHWLREYAKRLAGTPPIRQFQDYLLFDPEAVPHQPRNPFHRPPGVPFGTWFDSGDTAQGQALASKLGANSGYFQEYLNWAPSVSNLYDLVANLVQILGHEQTPEAFRQGLFPQLYNLCGLLEHQVALLRVHTVHAKHQGTALEGTWKALLTQIRLQANQSTFQPGIIEETLEKIDKELLTQQLKEATKSEAKRRHPGQDRTCKP